MMLDSLGSQDRLLDWLVVVDNDPIPGNEQIVRDRYPHRHGLEYIPSAQNLGPAGGIALGMGRALEFAEDHDWLVLVDDNNPPSGTTLLGDLERFGETMLARDPLTAGIGRVGAGFDWKRGRVIAMSRLAEGQPGDAIAVDTIGGGHFPFYLARAVREVGPFLSDLFFGAEELEYGLRLRRAGFSLYAKASLWQEAKRDDERIGLHVRPSLRLSDIGWRRYYDLRNLIYILRCFGRSGTAFRVSLVRGIGKPLANVVVNPLVSMKHLRMNLKACWHAWTERMGRTLEPDAETW